MKKMLSGLLILPLLFTLGSENDSSRFYAYYTKINSGEAFEEYSRTGPYADIVVQLEQGRLVFHRSSSYLPYWETGEGKWCVDEIVPRRGDGTDMMPDKINALSYVRIISADENSVVVHWRYEPDFTVLPNPYQHSGVEPTQFVDEYFFIRSDGSVKRTIKAGTTKIEDWENSSSRSTQIFLLSEDGIVDKKLFDEDALLVRTTVGGNLIKKSSEFNPASYWNFDEGIGDKTREEVSGKSCQIHGHKSLWKNGVSGTALQFDGYHSLVSLSAFDAPQIDEALTVECWAAVGAYPWNWAPFIKQGDDEGFFLGINSNGQTGFKIEAEEGNWIELVDDKKLDAFRWYHVAGTYDSNTGEMKLYIDGELRKSKKIDPVEIRQVKVDVQIGKGMKREATDVVRYESDVPAEYGYDGLIDEVKLYQTALTDDQIKSCYNSLYPGEEIVTNPDMQPRRLPETAPTNKFGARYTKLDYYETWDNMWRVGDHADLVVDFDESPSQFVFWRGTSFIPQMVTENGIWFNHEFNEIWATWTIQCMEPLADVKTNYSHVRLIENTDARVVVHWRYALNDVLGGIGNYDSETGWGEYSDWYYTIYPDGVAAVKMVLWSNLGAFRGSEAGHREWQESIAIIPPGKKPEDIIETKNTMSVSDLEGNVVNFDWGPDFDVTDKKIQITNLKSEYNPFLVGDFLKGNCYYGELTEYSVFSCWNHWPAAIAYNDGRNMLDNTRIGHSSTTQISLATEADHTDENAPWVTQYKMEGMTKKSATELAPLARSWMNSSPVSIAGGLENITYDQGQRAYIAEPSGGKIEFAIEANENSTVVNPAIVVKNWSRPELGVIEVNGERIEPGNDLRQGIIRDTDGSRTLVLWLKYESRDSLEISIQ